MVILYVLYTYSYPRLESLSRAAEISVAQNFSRCAPRRTKFKKSRQARKISGRGAHRMKNYVIFRRAQNCFSQIHAQMPVARIMCACYCLKFMPKIYAPMARNLHICYPHVTAIINIHFRLMDN